MTERETYDTRGIQRRGASLACCVGQTVEGRVSQVFPEMGFDMTFAGWADQPKDLGR